MICGFVGAVIVGLTHFKGGPAAEAFSKLPLWLVTLIVLRAGVVANPRVATKQQVVDGGGSELRAGDRIVTITSQPGLQANARAWRGARRCPK